MKTSDLEGRIRRERARQSRIRALAASTDKRLAELCGAFSRQIFGDIGDVIQYQIGTSMRRGIIDHFEVVAWRDLPLCILREDLNGIDIETRVESPEMIIKQDKSAEKSCPPLEIEEGDNKREIGLSMDEFAKFGHKLAKGIKGGTGGQVTGVNDDR